MTRTLVRVGALGALLLAACDSRAPSILEPRSPAARSVAGLWWVMLWLATAVFVVVVALLVVAILRRRTAPASRAEPPWGDRFIVVAGVVVPALILAGLFLVTLKEMAALSAPPNEEPLEIEVEGFMWWWEVRYPDAEAITANEIHIPAGRPVELELTTADVIHSVWVPELQVKVDMIPGTTNTMSLEADEPGTYRGQCAEFCGLQHTRMAFYVVAHEEAQFEEWLERESSDRRAPVDEATRRGEQLFLTSSCAGCHAIRGTDADAQPGPDLTHYARREYIAAGTVPNTEENLRRWIVRPDAIKPGSRMPPAELTGDEVDDVVAYLMSLD